MVIYIYSKAWFKLQVFGLDETYIYSWVWDAAQAKLAEDACRACGTCPVLFLFLPSSSPPFFLFLFSFPVYFRDWGGNDLSEQPRPVGQWAGTGYCMGVAPALTQARSARAHTFTATSVSLFRQPSCVLHERISHLSLPPQTELGVWMTCETSHLCKIPDPTFSLQPNPKTEKKKRNKSNIWASKSRLF